MLHLIRFGGLLSKTPPMKVDLIPGKSFQKLPLRYDTVSGTFVSTLVRCGEGGKGRKREVGIYTTELGKGGFTFLACMIYIFHGEMTLNNSLSFRHPTVWSRTQGFDPFTENPPRHIHQTEHFFFLRRHLFH